MELFGDDWSFAIAYTGLTGSCCNRPGETSPGHFPLISPPRWRGFLRTAGCTPRRRLRTKKPRRSGAKSRLENGLADLTPDHRHGVLGAGRQTHRYNTTNGCTARGRLAPLLHPIPPPPIQPGPLTRRHCSCTRSASSLRNVAVSRRSSNSSCSRRACNSTRSPSDNRRAMQSGQMGKSGSITQR